MTTKLIVSVAVFLFIILFLLVTCYSEEGIRPTSDVDDDQIPF